MSENDRKPHVSWWAHPLVLLVEMPIVAAIWLVMAKLYDGTSTRFWQSALIGLPFGLLAVVANRITVRKDLDFFVEMCLRPIPEGSRANSFWQRLLHALPFVIPLWAVLLLSEAYLHAYAPCMASFWLVWLLTYPEQVLIYRTATQRIGQPDHRELSI